MARGSVATARSQFGRCSHRRRRPQPIAAGAATKGLVAVGASRRPVRGPARFVAGGVQGRSVMATEPAFPKEVALRIRAPCEDSRPSQPRGSSRRCRADQLRAVSAGSHRTMPRLARHGSKGSPAMSLSGASRAARAWRIRRAWRACGRGWIARAARAFAALPAQCEAARTVLALRGRPPLEPPARRRRPVRHGTPSCSHVRSRRHRVGERSAQRGHECGR